MTTDYTPSIAIANSVDAIVGLLKGGMAVEAIAHIPNLTRLKEIIDTICLDDEESFAFFGYIPFTCMQALYNAFHFDRNILSSRTREKYGDILEHITTSNMYYYGGCMFPAVEWILDTFSYTHEEIERMNIYISRTIDGKVLDLIDSKYRFDRREMKRKINLFPTDKRLTAFPNSHWVLDKLEKDSC